MLHYRIYLINPQHRVAGWREAECETDEAAREVGREFLLDAGEYPLGAGEPYRSAEVWERARLVARIDSPLGVRPALEKPNQRRLAAGQPPESEFAGAWCERMLGQAAWRNL